MKGWKLDNVPEARIHQGKNVAIISALNQPQLAEGIDKVISTGKHPKSITAYTHFEPLSESGKDFLIFNAILIF